MALKINCILNQPSSLPEVIKLVEKTAHTLNKKKKSAKVEDVYREVRDAGVEIDAESIALAYQNVSGIMGKKGFSTVAAVKAFGGESMKRAIRIANEGDLVKSKLGKLDVSMAVASGLATTFSTLENLNDIDKSRLFKLQEIVRKAANAMLDRSGFTQKPKTSFVETLQNLFDIENLNITGKEAMNGKVRGAFSSIDAVWDEMKSDLEDISKGIKDKAQRARFDQMTEAIRKSSYDLLLGTRQADAIIKDILKEAGYTKTITHKGSPLEIVDWNKAMANQKDWRDEFGLVLRKNGFDITQTQRILNKLEGNLNKSLQRQAENKLNQIKKNNNLSSPVNKDAIRRMVELKNAGIFAPQNKAYLNQAMGYDVPQDISDKVSQILDDYQRNVSSTGNISNVFDEEVQIALRELLAPLSSTGMENILGNVSDYFALKAASIISTIFNSFQNITSGINAAFLPTISAIVASRNPKLVGVFLDDWINTLRDVTLGGVTIRNAKTVNFQQFENRGGLSDRWTLDRAKNAFGYLKASLNLMGQVTATGMDAANGTVIYDAEMVKSVASVLKSRGLSAEESRKAIDDIVFGKHSSGVSNRQFWRNEAIKKLENQEGVIARGTKASRVASELMWSELVSKYGVTINELKAMQSASLEQKSKNLGHQSDLKWSPSTLLEAGASYFSKKANDAKQDDDRGGHAAWMLAGVIFKAVNMFIGGKVNWAILALENTPVGVAVALYDMGIQHAFSKSGSVPLYKQKLVVDNPEMLEAQLANRKGINSRLERGIYGTIIQTMLYTAFVAMMKGGKPDDDRKKTIKDKFNRYMRDPATKRLMDKAAPMILATELQFAYKKDNGGGLDEKKISESLLLPYYLYPNRLDAFYDFYKANIDTETQLGYLERSYTQNKRIANDEKREHANALARAQFIGGLLGIPYTAWWNTVGTEVKLISNGLEPNPSGQTERSIKFRKQRQNINEWSDAFMNGFVTPDIYQGDK